jgi:hypothetical protein
MKKIFLLLVIIAIVFIAYNRERVFIRDPLAHVTRDGVKESGAQVFINFSNDVLIEDENPPMYITLVQRGQPIGLPIGLACIHWVACLTNADKATVIPSSNETQIESMTSKEVHFRDAQKREAVVTLR